MNESFKILKQFFKLLSKKISSTTFKTINILTDLIYNDHIYNMHVSIWNLKLTLYYKKNPSPFTSKNLSIYHLSFTGTLLINCMYPHTPGLNTVLGSIKWIKKILKYIIIWFNELNLMLSLDAECPLIHNPYMHYCRNYFVWNMLLYKRYCLIWFY